MAMMAPSAAAPIAAATDGHGLPALPSLPEPANAASTNWVVASTGMLPHVPGSHGATSLHAACPGIAIVPEAHGEAGSVGTQPPCPSGRKPTAHASVGTP